MFTSSAAVIAAILAVAVVALALDAVAVGNTVAVALAHAVVGDLLRVLLRSSAGNNGETTQRHHQHQLTDNPFLENRLVGVGGGVGLFPHYSQRDALAYSLRGEFDIDARSRGWSRLRVGHRESVLEAGLSQNGYGVKNKL